jgi:hypothetical protein
MRTVPLIIEDTVNPVFEALVDAVLVLRLRLTLHTLSPCDHGAMETMTVVVAVFRAAKAMALRVQPFSARVRRPTDGKSNEVNQSKSNRFK